MARTLSTNLAAKSLLQYGSEPITVVKIAWPSGVRYYTDKAYTFGANVCEPKILSLGNIVSQQKTDSSADVSSASISLDDTDATIKNSVNRDLLAGTVCTIYQTYTGLSDTDALILLQGRIANDVAWSEGQRTISFNIDTAFHINELGYAPKRGDLSGLSVDAEGKLWPIVFGSCLNVPALQIYKEVYGSYPNKDYTSFTPGSTFYVSGGENFPQSTSIKIRMKQGVCLQGSFVGNLFTVATNNVAYQTGLIIAARPSGDPDELNPNVLWLTTKHFMLAQYCHRAAANMCNLCVRQEGNKYWFAKPWKVIGNNAPVVLSSGTIDETSYFYRTSVWTAPWQMENLIGTTWTSVSYFTSWVTTYTHDVALVSGKIPTFVINNAPSTIKAVYAYRTYNGKRTLEPVPSSYYTKYEAGTIGGQSVTYLEFEDQLTDLVDENWEDQIYVSLVSSLGSNTSDVIKYLLETYTSYTTDTSFASVKTKITNYPSNFALFTQSDVLSLVAEIAYQARLAVRYNGAVAKLYYLSEIPTTISTFTDDSIRAKTLDYGFTSVDDIITKFTAKWKPSGTALEQEYVYKNNGSVFGYKETDYNFYIYNIESLVKLSTDFWCNRLSNSWRTCKLATFLSALPIETFDCVKVTTGSLATAGIRGEVALASQDTLDDTIALEIKLASKSGVHSSGVIIEDTTFFTGGVTGSEPMPADPTNGLAEVDYIVYHDPVVDTSSNPKQTVTIKIVTVPTRIVRGQSFIFAADLTNDDGSIHIANETFNLAIAENSGSDTLSPTTMTFVNGHGTATVTASGGSVDTEGVLNILGKIVGNTTYKTALSSGMQITSDPTLVWSVDHKNVARGATFNVTITGGLPSTTYTVSLDKTDAAEGLFTTADVAVASFTTNSSGNYSAAWKFKNGTEPLDSVTIQATHSSHVSPSPEFLVISAGGGADNLVVPAKVTAQTGTTDVVTCSLYPHGRTTESGDITWTGVTVILLQISTSSDKLPVNSWLLVVGTKKIPNTTVGDATDYNWYAQPPIWM